MNTRYLAILATLAFLSFSVPAAAHDCSRHADPNHKHCGGGDGGDPVTYTAELQGAFEFGPLSVTLEGQDERLISSDSVTIVSPTTGSLLTTWNEVFGFCGLLDPVPVFTASAGKKGWRISRPGGVYVLFRNVGPLPSTIGDLDVGLQLIGDCAYSSEGTTACDPFPPVPGEDYGHGVGISEIPLTHFDIHARGEKGITHSIEGCHSESADLLVDSTLVITATAPAP